MIATRSSSVRADQPPISFSVRPQPTQSPVVALTAQMRIQGLEIAMGSDTPPS